MIDFLKSLCFKAIIDENIELHKLTSYNDINLCESKNKKFGHFQFNDAIKFAQNLKVNPIGIAKLIKESIERKVKIEDIVITLSGPGFLNFKFSSKFIKKEVLKLFNSLKIKFKKKNVLLDYSSPNIAKNMHIGHLRSTIVGECLANLLQFVGYKVMKISHLGDWGTQFGLLIAHLKDLYDTNFFKIKISLKELSSLYKEAQERFFDDVKFNLIAKKEVVKLQRKDCISLTFWKKITKISKNEYRKIYSLLGITINYKGESFYGSLFAPIVAYLEKKNIVKISDEAKCIYLDKFCKIEEKNLPLIIQKSDGGYNYTTSEIATLYYRISYYKPDMIIYVTDIGQSLHFKMVFSLVTYLKFFHSKKSVKLIHIPLGLMLNLDGKKIKTRSGESESLLSVLFESIRTAMHIISEKARHISDLKLKHNSKILGINTLKYADLSNKLNQNYIFDKKNAFKYTGNTASFIMYAYVRICGIKKKFKQLGIKCSYNFSDSFLLNNFEEDLCLNILMYKYVIKLSVEKLNPNILTTYVYKLAESFHIFFHNCNVLGSYYINDRFILCDITMKIFKICFNILGLKIIDRM